MTRLEDAVAVLKSLPEDEQERAANAVIAFARERGEDQPQTDCE